MFPLVDPTPLYAWSLIWCRDDYHPRLPDLAKAFGAAGRGSRWLEYRPSADWLPDPDRAQAHNLLCRTGRIPLTRQTLVSAGSGANSRRLKG
jgi:hypothetical protein